MSANVQLNKKGMSTLAMQGLAAFNRYTVLLFFLLLAAVYGFVAVRIFFAHNAQPSADAISAEVKTTATPHIDPRVVDQMQSLQDHSVNVKTLFDEARSNPFHE